MFSLGFVAGYFLKSSWNKRSSVVVTSTNETNYVFSQKYKDCEVSVNKIMEQSKFVCGFDFDTYKKNKIDECMKNS